MSAEPTSLLQSEVQELSVCYPASPSAGHRPPGHRWNHIQSLLSTKHREWKNNLQTGNTCFYKKQAVCVIFRLDTDRSTDVIKAPLLSYLIQMLFVSAGKKVQGNICYGFFLEEHIQMIFVGLYRLQEIATALQSESNIDNGSHHLLLTQLFCITRQPAIKIEQPVVKTLKTFHSILLFTLIN